LVIVVDSISFQLPITQLPISGGRGGEVTASRWQGGECGCVVVVGRVHHMQLVLELDGGVGGAALAVLVAAVEGDEGVALERGRDARGELAAAVEQEQGVSVGEVAAAFALLVLLLDQAKVLQEDFAIETCHSSSDATH